jgi:hypothetical protein
MARPVERRQEVKPQTERRSEMKMAAGQIKDLLDSLTTEGINSVNKVEPAVSAHYRGRCRVEGAPAVSKEGQLGLAARAMAPEGTPVDAGFEVDVQKSTSSQFVGKIELEVEVTFERPAMKKPPE